MRRGDRAAEGAALEMPCTGNPCAAGSNPAPSANNALKRFRTASRSEARKVSEVVRDIRAPRRVQMRGNESVPRVRRTPNTPQRGGRLADEADGPFSASRWGCGRARWGG